MILRFAGFELDPHRAELHTSGGEVVKLRPKTFELLARLAADPGRTFSKQELIETLWPNIHVGDGSLFQCIGEVRAALGDKDRTIVKLVSGRGYRLDVEVTTEPPGTLAQTPPAEAAVTPAAVLAKSWRPFGLRGPTALAIVAVLGAALGLSIAAPMLGPDLFKQRPPAIAVMPITGTDADAVQTAAAVTARLADGLAKIDNIRVVRAPAPETTPAAAVSARADQADYRLSGELQKTGGSWELRARLTRAANEEVVWSAPVSVAIGETDLALQQSRLAAGLGHLLALRLNELVQASAPATIADGQVRVVVEQARALLNHTNKERFAAAEAMLEKALAGNPDNVNLGVALAALQLRGIQMVWYTPEQSIAAENNARATLERAIRARPDSIPVLEAYCRFLNATNYFVESLVACARTLSFDPWNGQVLFHIGIGQVQLGRFEEALATFKQADRFDTPQVSRWTWLLGAGMTLMLMDRSEEALPWLQKSLAITPGSGRTHMLLSAVYEKLGRPAEAKAEMARGLELRPGSNLSNVALPPRNASPIFIAAAEWIGRAYLAAGLPER